MAQSVLLTGAAGRVGTAILADLADEHEWRLMDRDPMTEDHPGEFVVADITDEETVRDAMEGIDVVIHLAGDPRPEAPWDSVLTNNIDGTQTIFEAAVDADVEKVVFASSNHAVGAYETEERTPEMYRAHDDYLLDGTELPRPGNLYGVSKAAGESLGRYYHDEHGLSVACVRIGNLTKGHPPIDYERGQAMWLSYRDCAHLFDRCIRAEYEYEIVYGISDNDRKYYSIDRAKAVLGYEPRDNSAEHN
ncbi:glucose-6-phosphate 1-dehydrogenase (NAD) [Natrialba magadii ATCC 43099]|uniref:NAD-dependent glucose-6-phosphate dehydrogenase n=1 Tax=Natrialba magadii (strain ATCC 43099 / DSM 3394 / CCM 3739 / CIP 104546 / IAM 13178 / JCM 8861 / NBRC 102185 / NCIMB 2190 / MS3) TaxID=547559 RepID=D3SWT0_NATMM|nr:NAD-dependent glucose-6-phosphate dehydrogenase Azf [Natrialba magadii]ADD05812.1 glucose-6-phosphate 1-dehydrogenase (NAD) [Natrialba magadii ATCC 43099]ELY30112.1 NAD-dependent epimerase/dehydratase [Natrialba magadii ATCC 43099]